MPATESRPRLSYCWKDYIKEINQKFVGGVNEFRNKLAMYAAEIGFEYKLVKNKPTQVTAICARKEEDGCLWRVHARVCTGDGSFVIRRLNNEHKCTRVFRQKCSSMLSSKVIAALIKEEVKKMPAYTATQAVAYIYDAYRFEVPYCTAYYALEKAKKKSHGDGASSYAKLQRYVALLLKTNPGSICVVDQDPSTKRFRRLFIAMEASIKGFLHCRPMLFFDGTFLTGKFGGTLLVAVGKDADNGIYPLAFALVASESEDDWKWFVDKVASIVHSQRRTLALMSDRNIGLVSAIRAAFPDFPYAFCIKHMSRNIELQFPGGFNKERREVAVKAFKNCAYAYTEGRFRHNFNELLSIDRTKILSVLAGTKFSNWANIYFKGQKYGEMCTNVAESFNKWIKVERHLPITELVDAIRIKLMRTIGKRARIGSGWISLLTPSMEQKLLDALRDSKNLTVVQGSFNEFEVEGSGTYCVNVSKATCTCNRWRIEGFPCIHAVLVYKKAGLNIYDTIDPFYYASSYRLCYAHAIHPVVSDPYELYSIGGPDAMLAPKTKRPAGRPPTRRKRSRTELKRQIKCGRCGKEGHNKKTCTEPI